MSPIFPQAGAYSTRRPLIRESFAENYRLPKIILFGSLPAAQSRAAMPGGAGRPSGQPRRQASARDMYTVYDMLDKQRGQGYSESEEAEDTNYVYSD
jgi:hypothetical protein